MVDFARIDIEKKELFCFFFCVTLGGFYYLKRSRCGVEVGLCLASYRRTSLRQGGHHLSLIGSRCKDKRQVVSARARVGLAGDRLCPVKRGFQPTQRT